MEKGQIAIAPGIDTAPDIETASDNYAARFAGPAGRYFLDVQERGVASLLDGASLLEGTGAPPHSAVDVGGGHGQLAGPLAQLGFDVTVVGSDARCSRRIGDSTDHVAFVESNLLRMPFANRQFDIAVSVRLISHIEDWSGLIAELCRVARRSVIIDYPTYASLNALSPLTLGLKRRIEKNTRTYRTFFGLTINRAFARHGFRRARTFHQFALPMGLHRAVPALRHVEEGSRKLGLTGLIGNPILARFDRKDR